MIKNILKRIIIIGYTSISLIFFISIPFLFANPYIAVPYILVIGIPLMILVLLVGIWADMPN